MENNCATFLFLVVVKEEVIMICSYPEVVEIPSPTPEVVEISPPPRKRGPKIKMGWRHPPERVSKVCVYMGVTSGGVEGEGNIVYCVRFSYVVPSKGNGKEKISVSIFSQYVIKKFWC